MDRQLEKSPLNSNISSTCSHNMVNFSPHTAVISWRVWGTPANFNGFRVLASLLYTNVTQRRSTKLCTMFSCLLGWYAIYIYIFGGSCHLTEFCQVQNSLRVQVLHSPMFAQTGMWPARLKVVGLNSTDLQPTRLHASLGVGSSAAVVSELGQTARQFTYSWQSTRRCVLTYSTIWKTCRI